MFFSHSYSFSLPNLSQLAWLLIPWVSQRCRRFPGWSMPLDCFSLTFVSSSLSPLCNSPNCPYSRAGSQTSSPVCLRVTKHLLSAQTLQLLRAAATPLLGTNNPEQSITEPSICPTSSICPLQLLHPTHCVFPTADGGVKPIPAILSFGFPIHTSSSLRYLISRGAHLVLGDAG